MTQPQLFDTAVEVDVERLARALFIHVCPLDFDRVASWDSGKAARPSWIAMARNIIEEMGWQAA